MNRLIAAGLFVLFFFTTHLSAQSNLDYKTNWAKVDSLIQQNLTRSALTEVQGILAKANAEKNDPQYIKALLHELKLGYNIAEKTDSLSIERLTAEIEQASGVRKAILQNILAGMYNQYYQANNWQIYQRTAVDVTPSDFQTWDSKTFARKITDVYLASLSQSKVLQETPVAAYIDILTKAEDASTYRPTLYDVLGHAAIAYFLQNDVYLSEAEYVFKFPAEIGFAPAADFVKADFDTEDQQATSWLAIGVFQNLLQFHLSKEDPYPIVDLDLKRLQFVHQQVTAEDKDAQLMAAYEALAKQYERHPVQGDVYCAIAERHVQAGQGYDSSVPDHPAKDAFRTAHELCRQTIRRYPKSRGAKHAKVIRANLERKDATLTIEGVNLPDKPFRVHLEYRNIDRAYFRVLRYTDALEKRLQSFTYQQQKEKLAYLRRQPAMRNWSQSLIEDGDFYTHSTDIRVSGMGVGRYLLLCGDHSSLSNQRHAMTYMEFRVSDLAYILHEKPEASTVDLWTVDRESGKPLLGITVEQYRYTQGPDRKRVWTLEKTLTTDQEGKVSAEALDTQREQYRFILKKGKDELSASVRMYYYGNRNEPELPQQKISIFTDRAIYRPGQTIYFKAIAMEILGENHTILPNKKLNISLKDVNNQEIAELKLTSNEYGSVSGQFTAPASGLTGRMTIVADGGNHSIRVEEYKRPTFEVSFEPIEGAFALKDEVSVTGKSESFSGAPISDAEVRYRVVRRARMPIWRGWWGRPSFPSSPEREITNGTLQTDAQGNFSLNFVAEPDASISPDQNPIFIYTVYADVVDLTGETRSAQTTVRVGYSSLEISMTVPEKIEKTKLLPFQLSTKNLNGTFQGAKGSVEVFQVNTPEVNYRERQWAVSDRQVMDEKYYRRNFPHDPYQNEHKPENWTIGASIATQAFDTEESKELTIDALRAAPPGLYKAVMTIEGESLRSEHYFTLFNRYQKQPPMPVWLDASLSQTTAEPNDTVMLRLNTSQKNLWVLVQLFHGQDILEEKVLAIGRGTYEMPILIKESHRGAIAIKTSWVCENYGGNEDLSISVPFTNRELTLNWATFRSPLQPGQEESWKLTVRGSQAEQVAAEMVATLYDASLDEFAPHNYGLILNQPRYYGHNVRLGLGGTTSNSLSGNNWNQNAGSFYQSYQQLNWFGFRLGYARRSRRSFGGRPEVAYMAAPAGAPAPRKSAAPRAKSMNQEALELESSLLEKEIMMLDQAEGSSDTSLASPPPPEAPQDAAVSPPIRSNLNETAFFFPQLETNEQGEIILNFTMPEALTRWKFLGLAHSKDLKIGTISGETVTQKELMVVPNLPRFFREQDSMRLSAKVINLSETALSGTIQLRLFDALTDLPVDEAFGNTQGQAFSVDAKESMALMWEIAVPEGVQAVKVQVVADAGQFSDGEEHILPVLSNRMLVTETRPFSIRGKKKKHDFQFPKLLASGESGTLKHHKLTLELTSNPAWHAVQSLPYLMEFPHECTEQIFSRFYANALGSHVANSRPQIQKVFKQWQSLPDQQGLVSQLEKNQELKTALLTETPWVLEAQSQSERKRRIGMLFDLNRMADEFQSSYRIIEQRQMASGGFSWFPGMDESRYITTLIASGLGHMQKLGVDMGGNPEVGTLVQGAVGFLDREIMKDHARLIERKADLSKQHLHYWHVQYLYMRSFHKDVPVLAEAQGAFDFYYSQAKTYWNKQSPYMQGMLSMVFHRYEDQQVGQDIVRGLKENAIFSQELGMYWKQDRGWYWYQAPIERQALMIEAFHEVTGDIEAVEEMKVWLLQNKRTNDWGTTKATVAACNALLLTGENLLATSDMVKVKLGGETIDPMTRADAKLEAGTGHFTTSWLGSEVRPDMGEIEVRRKGKGLAWGALYWQYFEQLDKITPAETPLSIQKSLFIEKASASGPVLTTIDEKTSIQPGDKIVVRIEVRVDRDMEFVHLKDMRAAGFEPISVLSQYKYQGGLGYYESTRDAATHFFMDRLPKGTWVLEYPLRASLGGDFSNGITSLQCMYAPEFSSHSAGIRVKVD